MTSEIVKMVAKKANLSESVAQTAVDTVLNMLKDKLPPSIGDALNTYLASSGTKGSAKSKNSALGELGNVAGALGGLFGKK
ncbi:MAG: hypothetical protein LBR81_09260 [Prevotellaceae bacterium]|jgi:uncharacterized protein (DUF2267 family)|nr:hypothetical protein [Prevotellaceae bacterium]